MKTKRQLKSKPSGYLSKLNKPTKALGAKPNSDRGVGRPSYITRVKRITLGQLEQAYAANDVVDPESLYQRNLIPTPTSRYEVVRAGEELTKPLHLRVYRISKIANQHVREVGGSVSLIKRKPRPVGKAPTARVDGRGRWQELRALAAEIKPGMGVRYVAMDTVSGKHAVGSTMSEASQKLSSADASNTIAMKIGVQAPPRI